MVSREQKVSESVLEYVKDTLYNIGGLTTDTVLFMEAWDGSDLETPLTTNKVAMGYSFDNGGQSGECGSDLISRLYTIEFLVFALNETWGSNLASTIQTAIERDTGVVPLLDIGEPGSPQIDTLIAERVSADRQPTVANPPAWARFVYTVRAQVRDEYYATL